MLKTLDIENIAVIEKASVNFSGGLNVLTGETGAGKSIVVDSINAIMGERTSRSWCDTVLTMHMSVHILMIFVTPRSIN